MRWWPRRTAQAARAAQPAPAWSLRRRLVASTVGATSLLWALSLAIVVGVAWRETSEVFDDALEEGARLALVLGAGLQQGGSLQAPPAGARDPVRVHLYYQLVAQDGRVLRRAERAPAVPFLAQAGRDDGFHNVQIDGDWWRVYVLPSAAHGFSAQVGQRYEERLELLEDMAENLVWPALGLLVLLGGVCWWLIRRLLQPIEHTAARIAAASPDDLQPVPTEGQPRELQPVVRALNAVLARLAGALQSERRFTADAAHELRTPLAGLRNRIQLLQRQHAAQAEAVLARDLQALRDDVDRCTALVENLLALARLDPERADTLARETVALAPLLGQVVELCAPAARARGTQVRIDCRADTLRAQPQLLASALRNLLDNAVRYSPPGSQVLIEAVPLGAAGGVRLAVRDNGPGVAPADRARLAERFFRVLGSGAAGSGLGLSIVARIAALHGGSLRFESGLDGQGLGVVIELPDPPTQKDIRKP